MKNKLRKSICDADNAMQGEDYALAKDLFEKIKNKVGMFWYGRAGISLIEAGETKLAHSLIFKMYDMTGEADDKIRPTKK